MKKIIPYLASLLTGAFSVFAQRINMTNLTNSNDLVTTYGFFVNQTEGWAGVLILFSTFFVGFISLKLYSSKQAFAASSFLTVLTSMFLWAIGWLNSLWVYVSILGCLFGIIMLVYSSEI